MTAGIGSYQVVWILVSDAQGTEVVGVAKVVADFAHLQWLCAWPWKVAVATVVAEV